jgi:hypothetical protein
MNTNLTTFKLIQIVLIIILMFLTRIINAQPIPKAEIVENSSIYLGLGLVINDYGLGGSVEVPMTHNFSFYGKVGTGGWGTKLGGGVNFYPAGTPFSSFLSIGYATASGLSNFRTELWTTDYYETQTVLLDLKRVGTINLKYSKNYRIDKKHRFVLTAGYAIPLSKSNYEVQSEDVILSGKSKNVLDIMEPGGFILGVELLLGLY